MLNSLANFLWNTNSHPFSMTSQSLGLICFLQSMVLPSFNSVPAKNKRIKKLKSNASSNTFTECCEGRKCLHELFFIFWNCIDCLSISALNYEFYFCIFSTITPIIFCIIFNLNVNKKHAYFGQIIWVLFYFSVKFLPWIWQKTWRQMNVISLYKLDERT